MLTGVFFLFPSAQGKFLSTDRISIKDKVIFQGIKAPVARHETVCFDSIKAISKDSIHHKKHRLIAALLAFPLGVFGLHRAYLGTSFYVPVIYIFTLGGGLGVLPFIDFMMILLSKDEEFHTKYTHNRYIFMWRKGDILRDSLLHK